MNYFKKKIKRLVLFILVFSILLSNSYGMFLEKASAQTVYCSLNNVNILYLWYFSFTITAETIYSSANHAAPAYNVQVKKVSDGTIAYRSNSLSQYVFPLGIDNLEGDTLYEVSVQGYCDEQRSGTNMSGIATRIVKTPEYQDPQTDPDEIISITPLPLIPPSEGTLDCIGKDGWKKPTDNSTGGKTCPPLSSGGISQAKGGGAKPSSLLHVYQTYSTDNLISLGGLQAEYLKTRPTLIQKLCSNDRGEIIISLTREKN